MTKQYEERDIMELDRAGGYYIRHVGAMTAEKLQIMMSDKLLRLL